MRAHSGLLTALALLIVPTGCAEEGPVCADDEVLDTGSGDCIPSDLDAGPMDAGDVDAGGDGGPDGGGCTTECSAPTPACVAGECVECETVDDCAGGEAFCDGNRCVDCRSHADCTAPDLAKCDDITDSCVGCTEDTHCTMGISGAGVCDTTAETCVECLPDRAEACDSGDNVCDPATSTCSDRPAGMLNLCAPCIASAECMEGMACVLQSYGSPAVPVGSYCLWMESASSPGPADNCFNVEPYANDRVATTVEGTSVTVCDLLLATCPALDDHRSTTCSSADACGATGVSDGVCHTDGRCTYRCNDPSDCPDAFDCVSDGGDMVCDV